MTVICIYLICANILAFLLMGIDKWKAKNGRWRISERTLLLTALAGGSVGGLLGMYLFRHKTQHIQFSLGLPAILIFHIILFVFLFTQVL